jgi:tetrahydromethanopterin S-methyltransferase subunit C
MIKQNIFIGFLTGVAANIGGILLYILLFSSMGIDETLNDAVANGYIGKIIALGAILNFIPFFVFLRKKQNYHARGVLLATIIAAITIFISKIV